MKINELRIENLVYLNAAPFKVIGINPPYIDLLGVNDSRLRVVDVDKDELQPIELTKEFFEKNGFILLKDLEYYGNYFISEDMRIDVYESYHGWVVHIDDKECCTAFSKCLKYVHELQNAYYVSTGEEMEVKL